MVLVVKNLLANAGHIRDVGSILGSRRFVDEVMTIHSSILFFFFIFKLYIIVLVLPNIKMNPSQVHMCSPS